MARKRKRLRRRSALTRRKFCASSVMTTPLLNACAVTKPFERYNGPMSVAVELPSARDQLREEESYGNDLSRSTGSADGRGGAAQGRPQAQRKRYSPWRARQQ